MYFYTKQYAKKMQNKFKVGLNGTLRKFGIYYGVPMKCVPCLVVSSGSGHTLAEACAGD